MNTYEDYKHKNKIGEYYGYPKCCIDNFMANILTGKMRKPEYKDNIKAANGTGFIPCNKHSEQILKRDINLEDIIHNRSCELPFPNDKGKQIVLFREQMLSEMIQKQTPSVSTYGV